MLFCEKVAIFVAVLSLIAANIRLNNDIRKFFSNNFVYIGKFSLFLCVFGLYISKIIGKIMAMQAPYSNASGEIIIKGILDKLQITISQLEKETGLTYSALQRIYNGETKKISIPVYRALKEWKPSLRDEYLRDAQLPILEGDEENETTDNVDIISILNNARQILTLAQEKEKSLKDWEKRLDDRSKELDQRARDLDATMRMMILQKNTENDNELAEKLSDSQQANS